MASTEERQQELLETYYFLCDCPKCLSIENQSEMFGAECTNISCDNSVLIKDNISECEKCGKVLSEQFVNEFKNVVEFTELHLNSMKNTACILFLTFVCFNKCFLGKILY